jgi:DNA replication protein DnaC
MKTKTVVLVLSSVLCNGPALGAIQASKPSAIVSTAEPQRIAQSWDELSPRERARALENYKRFKKLPPERRQNMEEKYNRWMQLPEEEKNRIQKNYNRYRKMDSDQKEEFQRKYKTWQSTPR